MSENAEVHPLLLAEVNLSGQYNPPSYADARIPVYGFLILSDEGAVLVDTGVGEGNDYIERRFEPMRWNLTEALCQHGVSPGDVTMLINSHLHFDHCGNNCLFANVPVYVQAEELVAAKAPNYTVAEWFNHEGAELHAVEGDMALTSGIRLIPSPGHTPGHQSVLVDTGDGPVLIAAQAAFTAEEFRRGGDPDAQAHEGLQSAYVDSMIRLKQLDARRIMFSHDS